VCVCVCVRAEAIGCEYRLGDKWAALQTLEGASMTSPNFPFPAASHTRFNHSLSSTYSTNEQTFSLQYGSGSLTGILGYDTLTVSDAAG